MPLKKHVTESNEILFPADVQDVDGHSRRLRGKGETSASIVMCFCFEAHLIMWNKNICCSQRAIIAQDRKNFHSTDRQLLLHLNLSNPVIGDSRVSSLSSYSADTCDESVTIGGELWLPLLQLVLIEIQHANL